jgi:hypothetical protein
MSTYAIILLVICDVNIYSLIRIISLQITCGLWKGNERAFSFRGDSNWLGFSKCANTDVVAGWCESGSVFVADVRQDCLSVIG